MAKKKDVAEGAEEKSRGKSVFWAVFNLLATIVAAVALGVTLIAAGFGACAAVPLTTTALSQAFSGTSNDETPFNHAELVKAANATRDYTVADNDREALYEVLHEINDEALTPYADSTDQELLAADDAYTLDEDALSHLDDVYSVVTTARNVLIVVAVLAIAACAHVGIRKGRRSLGRVFGVAGFCVLVFFACLAVWVAVDFTGFFAIFHSLFFSAGSWYFASDSLLITMYPTPFWIGMGVVWLVVTVALCLAAMAIGRRLRRRK